MPTSRARRPRASKPRPAPPRLEFHPATPDRWADVVALFGDRGACGGCWCMWGRLPAAVYKAGSGAANRRRLQRLVTAGDEPGVIAYADGAPIGWCSGGPRADFPRLATSRVLAPVDDQPVWSIVCLFVDRRYRGQGVATALLEAMVAQARRHGARIVEGYPVEPHAGKLPDAFAWTGLPSAFVRAGFTQVARRGATGRRIMRREIRAPRRPVGPGQKSR